MSEAEELLNNLTLDEITLYTTNPDTEEHIIVDSDRNITVPEALRRIAVQYDHKIETVTFDCPRYWDNNDLMTMNIFISYLRPDRVVGLYLADNVRVNEQDPNMINFDWLIGDEMSMESGKIRFSVCAKRITDTKEEIRWYSEINDQMYISESIDGAEPVASRYPDVINDLLTRMNGVLTANGTIIDTSLTQFGLAADAGVTGVAINEEAVKRRDGDNDIRSYLTSLLNKEITDRQESDSKVQNDLSAKINSLASGAPLAANSVNEMTDKKRIYVNTSDGKWYYHNGASWIIGGIYQTPVNSQSVELLLGKKAVQTTFTYDEVKELYDDNSYKVTKFDYNVVTETWYTSDDIVELVKTTTINSDSVVEVM